jgi:hypothetical protein
VTPPTHRDRQVDLVQRALTTADDYDDVCVPDHVETAEDANRGFQLWRLIVIRDVGHDLDANADRAVVDVILTTDEESTQRTNRVVDRCIVSIGRAAAAKRDSHLAVARGTAEPARHGRARAASPHLGELERMRRRRGPRTQPESGRPSRVPSPCSARPPPSLRSAGLVAILTTDAHVSTPVNPPFGCGPPCRLPSTWDRPSHSRPSIMCRARAVVRWHARTTASSKIQTG